MVTSNNSPWWQANQGIWHQRHGLIKLFLGLEVHWTSPGLFLSQAKYAHEILLCVKLVDSKLMSTAMVVAHHILTYGVDFDDPLLYRSYVGAL